MEANTVFEEFRIAVGDNVDHAAGLIIEQSDFWTTFEEDPPSWEECYELLDSLYAKHREDLLSQSFNICSDMMTGSMKVDLDLILRLNSYHEHQLRRAEELLRSYGT